MLPPHGDSEPERDFFLLIDDDLTDTSVSDVRRSIVGSYEPSGVTTALAILPYTLRAVGDGFEFSCQELDDIRWRVIGFDLEMAEREENLK